MSELVAIPNYSAELERAADPAQFVVQACERAKAWLAEALDHGDIDQIVELKSQAEAIRIYTMSKQLGKDAQLSAAEIVRRAERGLGIAIRRGQAAGDLRTSGQHSREAFRDEKSSPTNYFGGGQEQADTYAMTDGVSDGHFDAALASARTEGNLSRANVVRKVRAKRDAEEAKEAAMTQAAGNEWIPEAADRSVEAVGQRRILIRLYAEQGYSSHQISELIGTRDGHIREIARKSNIDIPADQAMGRGTRKTIDSNRIVRETVHALEGLAMGVELANVDDLDQADIEHWASSLTQSIRALNRLVKQMKEKTQ